MFEGYECQNLRPLAFVCMCVNENYMNWQKKKKSAVIIFASRYLFEYYECTDGGSFGQFMKNSLIGFEENFKKK